MLLRFRTTNFASIKDEQELSMVALDDHTDVATSPVPLSKERVLHTAGVFGPNASGKSNFIKAMTFGRAAVVESHQHWLPEDPIPRWPFHLDAQSRVAPSEFVFEFIQDQIRYEYGFSLNDTNILEEWLFSWPKGRRIVLFERSGLETEFGASLTGPKAAIAELVRENSLFLSAAAANNQPQLRSVAAWFRRWSRVSPGRSYPAPMGPLDQQTVSLLRYADVGVIGTAMVERAPFEDSGFKARSRFELVHQAQTDSGGESLPWVWESSGTQAWLGLSRLAISCLDEGRILTIDDLGGDLHPLLTAQLVGLFQDPRTNPRGAQLIFTGHDVNLLGRHVEYRLRRDQVWLTAKDAGGATKVYPLTEYGRVRDGVDDVEGRYLQGRYGAVPFFDRALLEGILRQPASDGA